MNLLELFSGTESISKVFRSHGFECFTVENNEKFNPSWCGNILEFNTKEKFDVIWASPPCTTFSIASVSHYWNNHVPKRWQTHVGIAYVMKTLEIIDKVKPKYWFIENPRGMLRKMGFMEGLPRHTVTYCQYGDSRMKPTDIWTNCDKWTPRPMCKNGSPCHEPAPRGSRTGTQGLKGNMERSVIPKELCEEIYQAVINHQPQGEEK